MKHSFNVILLILLFTGCKKPVPIPPPILPNVVDGLELTYMKTNIPKNFISICFPTISTGYIAGADGAIYKSTDGGNLWNALTTNTLLPLYDLYFFNADEGFAVGGESNCGGTGCVAKGAVILHTKDGGQTWSQPSLQLSKKIELKSVYFADDSKGFAVGVDLILSTTDRGATWQETQIANAGGVMMDVEFVNDKKGLIACTFGKLLKTTDGGIHWSILAPFPPLGANTLSLLNENLVFSAGFTNLEKSTDFGATWTEFSDFPTDVFKLVFKTENIGYAFGRGNYSGGDFGHNYGAIYFTADGGLSWKGSKVIEECGLIQSASFPTVNLGYAVSGNVVIRIKRL